MPLLPLLVVLAVAAAGCDTRPRDDVAGGAGAGAGDASSRADSLVGSWVDNGRIPGAVLLVTREGRVLHRAAYGHARLYAYGRGQYGAWRTAEGRRAEADPSPPDAGKEGEPDGIRRLAEPVPMTPGTVFDLASLTKVLATTFALMLLVDEGTVELDRAVSDYLPAFRGGGKDRVTVRHLLTHTGGLAPWTPVYYRAEDPTAAHRWVQAFPLVGEAGRDRRYSDLGFILLGRLVERVAAAPLDRFLEERLYGPLGLVATGFRPRGAGRDRTEEPVAATSHGNPFEHRMVHDTAFGYRVEVDPDAWDGWRRRTLVGEVNDGNAWHAFGGVAGHAGLFSDAAEVTTLLGLLLGGGVPGGGRGSPEAGSPGAESGGRAEGSGEGRLLSREVVETFLAEVVEGQALGWQVPPWAPPGSFAHSGFTGTWALGVPARGLTVVLLTNRQNGGPTGEGGYPDVDPLRRLVAEAFLP